MPSTAPDKADELDTLRIDQLHAATLKASDSCFELKKLCATSVVAVGTLISVFTNKALNTGVFAAGLAVIASFWLADTVGYYYQRRLRSIMDRLILARGQRSSPPYVFTPASKVGPLKAAFNGSMVFYLLLAVLVGFAWLLWGTGLITSTPPAK